MGPRYGQEIRMQIYYYERLTFQSHLPAGVSSFRPSYTNILEHCGPSLTDV
jgi:hypothetical protein